MIKALARTLLSLTALPLTLANPVMAKTVTLEPIGNWSMIVGKDACLVQRSFGDARRPSMLQFERYAPGDSFVLTAVGDDLRSVTPGTRLKVRYEGLGAENLSGTGMRGELTQPDQRTPLPTFTSVNSLAERPDDEETRLAAVTPETERAVTGLTLKWAFGKATFNTGPMGQPFALLRRCTDGLVRSWGLDPAVQASLSKAVKSKSNPGTWLSGNDYPSSLLASKTEGYVRFRLIVDAQGQPTSCSVQQSLNGNAFDEVTCAKIMERARFWPALDANGNPVASFYRNNVRWIMAR